MSRLGIIFIGLFCGAMFAQTKDGQPAFDVASIKPAPPPGAVRGPGGGMMVGSTGGPGSKDPTRYTCTMCNVSMLITQAYNVKYYQVSGPKEMEGDRFDIYAKVPDGATKDQMRLMLQNLLAERFKLVIHRDKKEMPVYELVVAKGGPKLKEAVTDPPKDGPSDDAPPPTPLGRGGRGPNLDKDGYPVLARGCKSCIMVVGGGKAHMHSEKQAVTDFADLLAGQLGKPVIDATGLKGTYDIDLSYDASDMMRGRGLVLAPGGGAPAAPDGNTPLSNSDAEFGVPINGAIQSQLGLKLEPKKGQVEIIVVDHVDKVPTEN